MLQRRWYLTGLWRTGGLARGPEWHSSVRWTRAPSIQGYFPFSIRVPGLWLTYTHVPRIFWAEIRKRTLFAVYQNGLRAASAWEGARQTVGDKGFFSRLLWGLSCDHCQKEERWGRVPALGPWEACLSNAAGPCGSRADCHFSATYLQASCASIMDVVASVMSWGVSTGLAGTGSHKVGATQARVGQRCRDDSWWKRAASAGAGACTGNDSYHLGSPGHFAKRSVCFFSFNSQINLMTDSKYVNNKPFHQRFN